MHFRHSRLHQTMLVDSVLFEAGGRTLLHHNTPLFEEAVIVYVQYINNHIVRGRITFHDVAG